MEQPTKEQLQLKAGDLVIATHDGKKIPCRTRSIPWCTTGGEWLIDVTGVPGPIPLTQCKPQP